MCEHEESFTVHVYKPWSPLSGSIMINTFYEINLSNMSTCCRYTSSRKSAVAELCFLKEEAADVLNLLVTWTNLVPQRSPLDYTFDIIEIQFLKNSQTFQVIFQIILQCTRKVNESIWYCWSKRLSRLALNGQREKLVSLSWASRRLTKGCVNEWVYERERSQVQTAPDLTSSQHVLHVVTVAFRRHGGA